MTSNPVWHNIFRYIVLKPDNITFEADNYKDTINIIRGPGVNWGGASSDTDIIGALGTDQFMINVDYDISIPLATTDLTLEDVNGNTSAVTFTAGRGVEIVRNSAQELEWRSYSVTETDTLQTVTERNNITNNKIFVNDIEVGTISSSYTEDGFTSYDAGHDLVGSGTLDSPLNFSPLYKDSLIANSSDQFKFTALGPGVLAYSASYVFDTGAVTGSVKLEREDPSSPGTWVTLDIVSGVTLGYSYAIQGTYAELHSGSVNYRLTYSWTGNTGIITWHVFNTFEGGAYSPILEPQIRTDTTAKTVDINDLHFFQNNIRTTVSNMDIVLDPAGAGRVVALSNIVAPTFVGNLNGNADTVTNGVYTTGSYANPSWITSLAGTKVTNAVLTTGSYANPSWITSLDASKIIGSISLSDITIDGDIKIYDNVIETTLSNANLELRANGTGIVYIPDGVTATGAITFNTTTNNQSYTTTGAGTITITSGTLGTINNMSIGGSTAAAGTFTSLTATSANVNVNLSPTGTGSVTINPTAAGTLDNMTIGGTTAKPGTFTQIVRSGNVSASAWGTTGVGIRTAAGIFTDSSTSNSGTATNAHINVLSQPTIAATSTNVTVTNAATLYIANAPTNGTNVNAITNPYSLYVAAGAVYFAGAATANSSLTVNGALTASGSNAAINMSPTGVSGTITMNPAGGGSLDNFNVGSTTRGSGAFTTLAANNTTTLQQITEILNTKTGATGVVAHDYSTGDIFYHSSISANFTVNLTNVPTTNDRTIVVTLILNQGAAGYYPSAVQIGGVAQTLRWANNVTPTPSANKIDVAVFTLIRTGSTWYVLGNYTTYN